MDTLSKARQIKDEVISWRREIHRWPELGCQEVKTCALVMEALKALGVECRVAAGTGVIGLIKGGMPGKTIALRADMDALPIQEESGLPFASQRPGIMHACGHDAHAAMLLGAAKILAGMASKLKGNVKLLFQPSEEHHPGGAKPLIAEGALENPRVDLVVGLHVDPLMPGGHLGLKTGTVMAAADTFELRILGKGGHGAAPHLTVDPVVLAAQVVLALQTIASRRVDPLEPVVVTVGSIHGGEVNNIIPEEVSLKGTVRTLSPLLRQRVQGMLVELVSGIVRGAGGDFDLQYRPGYPPVVNDTQAASLVKAAAAKVLGPEGVVEVHRASMGGEDFAYYAQEVPGCFAFLGVGTPDGEPVPWHNPRFKLDEDALIYGTAVLVQAALDFLGGNRDAEK